MTSILVISEGKEALKVIKSSFSEDFQIKESSSREAGFEIIAKTHPAFVFMDTDLLKEPGAGKNAKWRFQELWGLSPGSEIIVMSPKEKIRDAVNAVKAGATDFITYPVTEEEVRHVINSIFEYATLQAELEHLREQSWKSNPLELLETNHQAMKEVLDRARLVAETKATVFLTGETGTGKGVVANLIHRHSNRKDNQFIEVHCGAIPDNLLESELFGHEKGAFTGAVKQKLGKFEVANGGTIFLDEVGTLTPAAQIKLLKVLEKGLFQHVGGEKTIEVDVRVISATNLDLKKACENGQFRLDLYHRLNVFAINIPSLRERVDDVPFFIDLFLKRLRKKYHKDIHGIHHNVTQDFKTYSWPGNIRELENLLERAFILGHSPILTEENFPEEIVGLGPYPSKKGPDSAASLAEVRRTAVNAAESSYLRELLVRHNGKIQESAVEACISTRQLNKLMVKHKINKKDFKSG